MDDLGDTTLVDAPNTSNMMYTDQSSPCPQNSIIQYPYNPPANFNFPHRSIPCSKSAHPDVPSHKHPEGDDDIDDGSDFIEPYYHLPFASYPSFNPHKPPRKPLTNPANPFQGYNIQQYLPSQIHYLEMLNFHDSSSPAQYYRSHSTDSEEMLESSTLFSQRPQSGKESRVSNDGNNEEAQQISARTRSRLKQKQQLQQNSDKKKTQHQLVRQTRGGDRGDKKVNDEYDYEMLQESHRRRYRRHSAMHVSASSSPARQNNASSSPVSSIVSLPKGKGGKGGKGGKLRSTSPGETVRQDSHVIHGASQPITITSFNELIDEIQHHHHYYDRARSYDQIYITPEGDIYDINAAQCVLTTEVDEIDYFDHHENRFIHRPEVYVTHSNLKELLKGFHYYLQHLHIDQTYRFYSYLSEFHGDFLQRQFQLIQHYRDSDARNHHPGGDDDDDDEFLLSNPPMHYQYTHHQPHQQQQVIQQHHHQQQQQQQQHLQHLCSQEQQQYNPMIQQPQPQVTQYPEAANQAHPLIQQAVWTLAKNHHPQQHQQQQQTLQHHQAHFPSQQQQVSQHQYPQQHIHQNKYPHHQQQQHEQQQQQQQQQEYHHQGNGNHQNHWDGQNLQHGAPPITNQCNANINACHTPTTPVHGNTNHPNIHQQHATNDMIHNGNGNGNGHKRKFDNSGQYPPQYHLHAQTPGPNTKFLPSGAQPRASFPNPVNPAVNHTTGNQGSGRNFVHIKSAFYPQNVRINSTPQHQHPMHQGQLDPVLMLDGSCDHHPADNGNDTRFISATPRALNFSPHHGSNLISAKPLVLNATIGQAGQVNHLHDQQQSQQPPSQQHQQQQQQQQPGQITLQQQQHLINAFKNPQNRLFSGLSPLVQHNGSPNVYPRAFPSLPPLPNVNQLNNTTGHGSNGNNNSCGNNNNNTVFPQLQSFLHDSAIPQKSSHHITTFANANNNNNINNNNNNTNPNTTSLQPQSANLVSILPQNTGLLHPSTPGKTHNTRQFISSGTTHANSGNVSCGKQIMLPSVTGSPQDTQMYSGGNLVNPLLSLQITVTNPPLPQQQQQQQQNSQDLRQSGGSNLLPTQLVSSPSYNNSKSSHLMLPCSQFNANSCQQQPQAGTPTGQPTMTPPSAGAALLGHPLAIPHSRTPTGQGMGCHAVVTPGASCGGGCSGFHLPAGGTNTTTTTNTTAIAIHASFYQHHQRPTGATTTTTPNGGGCGGESNPFNVMHYGKGNEFRRQHSSPQPLPTMMPTAIRSGMNANGANNSNGEGATKELFSAALSRFASSGYQNGTTMAAFGGQIPSHLQAVGGDNTSPLYVSGAPFTSTVNGLPQNTPIASHVTIPHPN